MNWNAHTAIFEKFTFQTLSHDLSFDTQQGKSSKNNPQSNLGFNLLKQRLLWHHFAIISGQNPVSRSTLLNINISVSLALCLLRQFESKIQVKFDFNWIWTYFNSNCHFFAFVVTDIIQFSWFANNWIPLCSHQCLTYCNIHNLHACIICRFAYHAMHRICRYCNLHTNCNQLDIVCSRSHLKYWHHIVRVFFHQCVANIQNAVFLQ